MTDERFNCGNCKLSDKRPNVLKRMQDAKGCRKPTKTPFHSYRRGEITWDRCPANYMNGKVKHYVKAMRMKRGNLNSIGDITKKPMKVVELLEIIDNLFIEQEIKESNGQSKSRN